MSGVEPGAAALMIAVHAETCTCKNKMFMPWSHEIRLTNAFRHVRNYTRHGFMNTAALALRLCIRVHVVISTHLHAFGIATSCADARVCVRAFAAVIDKGTA